MYIVHIEHLFVLLLAGGKGTFKFYFITIVSDVTAHTAMSSNIITVNSSDYKKKNKNVHCFCNKQLCTLATDSMLKYPQIAEYDDIENVIFLI